MTKQELLEQVQDIIKTPYSQFDILAQDFRDSGRTDRQEFTIIAKDCSIERLQLRGALGLNSKTVNILKTIYKEFSQCGKMTLEQFVVIFGLSFEETLEDKQMKNLFELYDTDRDGMRQEDDFL